MNNKTNTELYRLCKGFKSLSVAHQKRVVKTAQGLLKIQRACKTEAEYKTRHISSKGKNEK
jgi:hypothetical protein